MVSPNWPSDDDPDYTPDFSAGSSNSVVDESDDQDLEEIKEELKPIVDTE